MQAGQAAHSMSVSASVMATPAQHCSSRTSLRPLSASVADFSAKSDSMHHGTQQAGQALRSRPISSTTMAAESMSEDKTDLNVGAATAAAEQTMRQQPSAHGLQAAPQVAKVLGFAGAALSALAVSAGQHSWAAAPSAPPCSPVSRVDQIAARLWLSEVCVRVVTGFGLQGRSHSSRWRHP